MIKKNNILIRNSLALLLLIITFVSYGQNTRTFKFTIEGMTCQGCVNTATQTLKKVKGVDSVSVDLDSKQAIVITHSNVTEKDLETAIKTNTNFDVLFKGETLPQSLTEKEKEGLDIKTIKGGNKIKFKEHLAQDKITIFDFYADWCGPCRVFSPKVERLLLDRDHLALRKVDIVDWKSALSKQLTKDYKLPALPFTLIFDDKGNLLGIVEGNNIEQVQFIIDKQG